MSKYYFTDLSAAIAAINNGTTGATTADESSKVEVQTTSGEPTKVKLLGDVSESATITVNKDIDLVLNGFTLRFTEMGAYLYFSAGTCSLIHGAGGSIAKELDASDTAAAMLMSCDGSSLQIRGGSYILSANTTGTILTLRAAATCELLELEDCTIEVKNTTGMAIGVQTQAGNSHITRTHCTAKAAGNARGFMSAGIVRFLDCHIEGSSTNSDSNAVRVINGNVSADACSFAANAQEYIARTIYIVDGTVSINGSRVQSDAYNYLAMGIELYAGVLNVRDSSVTATAHQGSSASSTGIGTYSNTLLRMNNSTILADSTPNCDGAGNNTGGIANGGTAYLENVRVFANHSAVQNNGKLYVHGGSYTGYCHGGFYFCHGSEGEAFVNDAILRGGHYEGIFDYSNIPDNIKLSTMYIGGGTGENDSNVTAYLDSCFFDASDCHRSIVVRGSSGEQNNTLNISNCTITDGTLDQGTIRIDNETLKLNVGRGCNVTSDMFKNGYIYPNEDGSTSQVAADYIEEGVVEYTNALYRKFPV